MINITKYYKNYDEAVNKINRLEFNHFVVYFYLTRNVKLGLTAKFEVDKKNVDELMVILNDLELEEF